MRSHEHGQMPEVIERRVVAVEFAAAVLGGKVSPGYDGEREGWRKGRAKGRSTPSSLGLEIMSWSVSGWSCDSKEVRGLTEGRTN
jgi:hypothetical protein